MLAAYVDGEAQPDQRASVDAHIQRCPPCRSRVAAEEAARQALWTCRDRLRACASESLKARCAAQRRSTPAGLLTRRAWVPLSLAATLVLAVAGVFLFGVNSGVHALATQLTLDHVKCFKFAPSTPVSDAQAAARGWSASQGWDITVPSSSETEQLQLLCVRRCFVTEGRAAHIMYTWRGQPLSVFVLPSALGRAPERRDIVERFGHEAVMWTDRGRTYVVLARGRPDELEGVVGYVRTNAR